MRRKSSVFKIVVVIVLLAFLGVGAYALMNNAVTTTAGDGSGTHLSVTTFYVTIDNKKITDHGEGYVLVPNESLNVAVSFPFGKIDPTSTDYTVKIVPSGEVNFEFAVGTTVHSFVSESDLTSMFAIDKQDDSFTVSTSKSLIEFVEGLYPQETVYVDFSTLTGPNLNMFRIIVTSGDGSVITIDFSFAIMPESISLNSEVVVF